MGYKKFGMCNAKEKKKKKKTKKMKRQKTNKMYKHRWEEKV
jgi:hypothetical protein